MMERIEVRRDSSEMMNRIREAYAVAHAYAAATKTIVKDSWSWIINETTHQKNQMREDGYDDEAIKANRRDISKSVKKKFEAEQEKAISEHSKEVLLDTLERHLPRRDSGVVGLYRELEASGFDMSQVTASWMQNENDEDTRQVDVV